MIIQQPPVTDNGKIEFFNFLPDCRLGIFGQNSCFPKTESIGWTAASQILSSIDRASLIFAFPALTGVSKKRWKQLTKTHKVGGEYILSPTRTGRARYITVASYVMQLLRKRKEQLETERVIAGEGWDNSSNLVFTNALGGHLVHVSVYKDFKDIAASLGLEGVRYNKLRKFR